MTITQHLIVEEYGAFISKHSERIVVKRKDEKIAQAPLLHLESVLIASALSVPWATPMMFTFRNSGPPSRQYAWVMMW